MENYILLNPGPVNVTETVRQALLKPDMCHREKEYFDVQDNIRRQILKAFSLSENNYTAVLLTGSGTAALEMSITSSVPHGKKILVVNNGVYGQRIMKIADLYNIATCELKYQWGQRPDINDIENKLKEEKDIDVVAMVHHETTTGLLNPIEDVGKLAKKYNKLYVIDAISSLAGEDLDFNTVKPDIVVCTANKCVQGMPGIAFTIVTQEAINRIADIKPRNLYLDMHNYFKSQEAHGTPFTPSVQIAYALNVALSELIAEGVDNRIKRYANASTFLRKHFKEMKLKYLIDERYMSNTITSLYLPDGVTYTQIHDAVKKDGFIIYAGQGDLAKLIFRVANMGEIKEEHFQKFITSLKGVIKS